MLAAMVAIIMSFIMVVWVWPMVVVIIVVW